MILSGNKVENLHLKELNLNIIEKGLSKRQMKAKRSKGETCYVALISFPVSRAYQQKGKCAHKWKFL
jgi:hypothetical protein